MSVPSSEDTKIARGDSITVDNAIDPVRNGRTEAGYFFMNYQVMDPSIPIRSLSWDTWTTFLTGQCAYSPTEHLLKCTIDGEDPIYIFHDIQWKSTLSRLKKLGKKVFFEIVSKKDTYAEMGIELPEPEPAVISPRSPVFGEPHHWRQRLSGI
ncbi:hypothetical protein BDV38DRAFT_282647 [Aspergillus pseudotamarii]|uniref:Uncharacterized protein n=1 Tax=Aspergillus pseudotamarii TaxID=132259 RepID=A0A5N6SSW1_ASPPS|nr:uncharacterized protein BDV38DRAFT_282647 [Aspergillus pseudotamarii]KAE8137712.1 hypothetical protein BDV38DRAFT_282647 [Aspergillus pseudotamarii]